MFHINDVVVYGAQGVCQIVGVDEQKSGKYFILKPKSGATATFFVPTWNEKALAKLRKVLTKEEVDALIDSMPSRTPDWIENENQRKETYKQILASGDHAAIISMIQALYFNRQNREAEGKRLHISDEHFMKEAEQLLHNAPRQDAEWHFLTGSVAYRKGWLDEASRHIQIACSMDPSNGEYRQAMAMLRNGGGVYRSYGGGMDSMDCCTALLCWQCLCGGCGR